MLAAVRTVFVFWVVFVKLHVSAFCPQCDEEMSACVSDEACNAVVLAIKDSSIESCDPDYILSNSFEECWGEVHTNSSNSARNSQRPKRLFDDFGSCVLQNCDTVSGTDNTGGVAMAANAALTTNIGCENDYHHHTNIKYSGDLISTHFDSDCCGMCSSNPDCRGFTFITASTTCQLFSKVNVGDHQPDECCESYTNKEDPGSCFPADAEVTLLDGSVKPVSELKPGDRVMTASELGEVEFTDFFGFGFAVSAHDISRQYISIEYVDQFNITGNIELTRKHFIFRSTKRDSVFSDHNFPAIEARIVKLGDYLWTKQSDGMMGSSRVVWVDVVQKPGQYAPLTLTGTLLVNGALASSFDDPTELGLSHEFWQNLAFPCRLIYNFAGEYQPIREAVALFAMFLGHTVTWFCDNDIRYHISDHFLIPVMAFVLLTISVKNHFAIQKTAA